MSPYIPSMTPEEKGLLLTVARILRATIQDALPTANGLADIDDLNEALRSIEGGVALPETRDGVRLSE